MHSQVGKRPLAVTIVGIVYILAGAIGLIYHLSDWRQELPLHHDIVWISLIRVLAIVAGIYLLRGADWARWLALAWMAFHVVISYWKGWIPVAMHTVFLAVIAYFLLRKATSEYFHRQRRVSQASPL